MKPKFAEKVAMLFGVDDDGRANAYSKTFLGIQNKALRPLGALSPSSFG
jgi:hypothetical protein